MLQDIDLRELAEMESSGRDFVSLYFSRRDGFGSLSHREGRLRDLLEDAPDEREHFDETMRRIHALLDNQPVDAEGACVFGSAVLDFVKGYPLEMPVPNVLRVGVGPYIRPLAELQDEYTTFAVVACDNEEARVYLVTNETADLEDRVRGDVKNRVRKGGWSQKRYARRRDHQLRHYAKEIAARLSESVRRRDLERILLVGSEETMREIEEQLPDPVAEKVIGREIFDLDRRLEEIVDRAYGIYFEEERSEERSLWERVKGEYMSGGLAALGGADVLEALEMGRADTVIVTRDAQLDGTRCRECGQVAPGKLDRCPGCRSDSVFAADLVEAMVERAERTSAAVEFSDEIPGLSKVGHVAALLRY